MSATEMDASGTATDICLSWPRPVLRPEGGGGRRMGGGGGGGAPAPPRRTAASAWAGLSSAGVSGNM